jgi:hypothetical protein
MEAFREKMKERMQSRFARERLDLTCGTEARLDKLPPSGGSFFVEIAKLAVRLRHARAMSAVAIRLQNCADHGFREQHQSRHSGHRAPPPGPDVSGDEKRVANAMPELVAQLVDDRDSAFAAGEAQIGRPQVRVALDIAHASSKASASPPRDVRTPGFEQCAVIGIAPQRGRRRSRRPARSRIDAGSGTWRRRERAARGGAGTARSVACPPSAGASTRNRERAPTRETTSIRLPEAARRRGARSRVRGPCLRSARVLRGYRTW